jgi:hypothetical protein
LAKFKKGHPTLSITALMQRSVEVGIDYVDIEIVINIEPRT